MTNIFDSTEWTKFRQGMMKSSWAKVVP
jgi:hypothetical protein